MKNKYPIYVISKGRHENCLTAKFLLKDKVPFKLVVEEQEKNQYANKYGSENVLVLPFKNIGQGSIPARNFVWDHSKDNDRHWILDDNINLIRRWHKGRRIKINSGIAFHVVEEFTDRYENIAISGLNYTMFGMSKKPPFHLNNHVYSTLLIKNDLPYRWRGRYNEDTDLCLQVLSGGYCTVLINAFMIEKRRTMTMKGGNTDILYDQDGRLRMARALEKMWPVAVKTDRRFNRPQHVVKDRWSRFDNKLIKRTDIDWDFEKVDEFGMKIKAVKEIKSEDLHNFYVSEYKRLK